MGQGTMEITAYLGVLKSKSLKVTPRRKSVIELFLEECRYLGPQEIRDLLRRKSVRVGLPSVYRILEELEGAGILIRIGHEDRRLYYSLCRHPHIDHHHFICRRCKKVEEVDFCNFSEISRFIEKKLHGKVQRHSLHIEGLCSECRK